MKITLILMGALLLGCAVKNEKRSPSQVEAGMSGSAVWDEDVALKQKQLAEEDKIRRDKPRTDAFRTENLKAGFPIALKIVGDRTWGPEIFSYQRECFTRMVEEFLDFQPNPRAITEESVRNVTVSELKGWSNTRNFFTFSLTDSKNENFTGHMYVNSGIKKDAQNNDHYYCASVPGKGYDMIELKSSNGLIFSSSCLTKNALPKCAEIK